MDKFTKKTSLRIGKNMIKAVTVDSFLYKLTGSVANEINKVIPNSGVKVLVNIGRYIGYYYLANKFTYEESTAITQDFNMILLHIKQSEKNKMVEFHRQYGIITKKHPKQGVSFFVAGKVWTAFISQDLHGL